MHGHHHHAVLVRVVAVQVGVQGDLIQETGQRGLVPGVLQVAPDGGQQLPHVLQAGAVLHGVFGLQHGAVAGADDQLLIELVQGQLPQQLPQLAHQAGKYGQLSRRPLQLRVLPGVVDDGVQGGIFPPGHLLGSLHRF